VITTGAGKSTVLLWAFEKSIRPQRSLSLERAKCEGPKPTMNIRNGAKKIRYRSFLSGNKVPPHHSEPGEGRGTCLTLHTAQTVPWLKPDP
jgi:hypothetical protein